jgi:hypothetical protein
MNGSIRLHHKHCLAPALMVCPLCGQHTNGLALLGAYADKVMKQLGHKDGYQEYGHNDIPDSEPCDECKGILHNKGIIFIAKDTNTSLRLPHEEIVRIGFNEELWGKVVTVPRTFWEQVPEGIKMNLSLLNE